MHAATVMQQVTFEFWLHWKEDYTSLISLKSIKRFMCIFSLDVYGRNLCNVQVNIAECFFFCFPLIIKHKAKIKAVISVLRKIVNSWWLRIAELEWDLILLSWLWAHNISPG